ncbi:hypothetical protein F5Y17DRAFT_462976 [Xylariaceae sp. FL0594]|nr:hypothetical protein F5Y17DRAFT_462976 [Xylariaceae sp. FL0594]
MQVHVWLEVSLILVLWTSWAFGIPNCPFQGPAFPKPTNLAASPTIQTALKNLTAAFEAYDQDSYNAPDRTSWSLQIIIRCAAMGTLSTQRQTLSGRTARESFSVGPDTIYRLGSLTKIFHDPDLSHRGRRRVLEHSRDQHHERATLLMGGHPASDAIESELTQEHNQTELMSQGFPPPPLTVHGAVLRRDHTLALRRSGQHASHTRGYSNLAYQLIAVIRKLGLTVSQTPPRALGLMAPGNEFGWNFSLGEFGPGNANWVTGTWQDAIGPILPSNIPALETAARGAKQAEMMFAGKYVHTFADDDNTNAPSSSSSLTPPETRRLGFDEWARTWHGTRRGAVQFNTLNNDVRGRLLPTGPEYFSSSSSSSSSPSSSSSSSSTRKIAFKAMIENTAGRPRVPTAAKACSPPTACGTWCLPDRRRLLYADLPLDQFVFVFTLSSAEGGREETMESVTPLALRVVLKRQKYLKKISGGPPLVIWLVHQGTEAYL